MKTEAFITTNKNRLKHYDENVYLKHGTQFEIELFNSYTTPVLAKISINNQYISNSGIVLKPGERYFLDRYIDTNNKFEFQTYQVEDSQEVRQAIKSNGLVKVEFFHVVQPNYLGTTSYPLNPGIWKYEPPQYTRDYYITFDDSNSGTITLDNANTMNITNFDSNSVTYTSNSVTIPIPDTKDTGRVEPSKERSEQQFVSSELEFCIFPFNTIHWKILPTSQKPLETNQLRNYCSNCGLRIKKSSWKFCPGCGQQI